MKADFSGRLRHEQTQLAAAGNTEAPALASLRRRGYSVSKVGDSYRADGAASDLLADDLVQLLGLAALLDDRGPAWRPTDDEVDELLKLEGDADTST